MHFLEKLTFPQNNVDWNDILYFSKVQCANNTVCLTRSWMKYSKSFLLIFCLYEKLFFHCNLFDISIYISIIIFYIFFSASRCIPHTAE